MIIWTQGGRGLIRAGIYSSSFPFGLLGCLNVEWWVTPGSLGVWALDVAGVAGVAGNFTSLITGPAPLAPPVPPHNTYDDVPAYPELPRMQQRPPAFVISHLHQRSGASCIESNRPHPGESGSEAS